MPIGLSVLSSGSKGNCIYISGDDGAVIVDAGLSAREILRRLAVVGCEPLRIKGILVTHEHTDHVRGLAALARKLKTPVYGTAETLDAIHLPRDIGKRSFRAGRAFDGMGFEVMPFSVPHDARDPVGFVIRLGTTAIGVATDLGYGTALVKERLKGCRAVVLESNHDERMLMEGPYPWFLKQRVRSRRGHLSNDSSAEMLSVVQGSGLQLAVLAHLSEINNRPHLALGTATEAVRCGGGGPRVEVASVYEPLPMMWLDE